MSNINKQLEDLQMLVDSGMLSPEEAEETRAQILANAPVSLPPIPPTVGPHVQVVQPPITVNLPPTPPTMPQASEGTTDKAWIYTAIVGLLIIICLIIVLIASTKRFI